MLKEKIEKCEQIIVLAAKRNQSASELTDNVAVAHANHLNKTTEAVNAQAFATAAVQEAQRAQNAMAETQVALTEAQIAAQQANTAASHANEAKLKAEQSKKIFELAGRFEEELMGIGVEPDQILKNLVPIAEQSLEEAIDLID